MNVRKFIVASAVGGLVILVLIVLVFGLLLSRFFADNMTNAEVMRMPPLLWSMFVSCLAEGALICYVLGIRGAAGASAVESPQQRRAVHAARRRRAAGRDGRTRSGDPGHS